MGWVNRLNSATNGNNQLRQEAIGSNTAFANSLLPSPPPPPTPTFPPFVKVSTYSYESAYPYGIGKQWGETSNARFINVGNKYNPDGSLKEMPFRVWKFVAPQGRWKGTIQINPGATQVTCIGHYPGDFIGIKNAVGVPVARWNGGNVTASWSTVPGVAGITFVSGETYYITAAHFSLQQFVNTGNYIPIEGSNIIWATTAMQPA